MNSRLSRRAAFAAAFAAFAAGSAVAVAAGAASAPIKPDYHLPSNPDTIKAWWDPNAKPALTIKSGQVVEIDTVCMFGMTDDHPEQFFIDNGIPLDLPVVKDMLAIKQAILTNPALKGAPANLTGPIFVEGAMPGDTLEVRILDIKSRAPYGVNQGRPGGGGIPDLVPRPYMKVIKLDLDHDVAKFSDTIEIPLKRFMGKLGVAPPKERGKLGSGAPYPDVGSNMDNKYFGKGATVYFPVHVDGALFLTGDPHANQGNGEVSGSAIESSNTVTMQFFVRKDLHVRNVRAEDAKAYIIMGMDTDLNKAMHESIAETVGFLQQYKHLDFTDALALSSTGVDFEVTEVVDGTKVISGLIPKKIFKDGSSGGYWYTEGR